MRKRKRVPRKIPKAVRKFHYVDKDGNVQRKETSIEKKTRMLLASMGIEFEQEKFVKLGKFTKCYDFLCYKEGEYLFFIECNGMYFHGAKHIFEDVPLSKLSKLQQRNVQNDKVKKKIAEKLGIDLLVLWEDEINKAPKLMRVKIRKMIESQKDAPCRKLIL